MRPSLTIAVVSAVTVVLVAIGTMVVVSGDDETAYPVSHGAMMGTDGRSAASSEPGDTYGALTEYSYLAEMVAHHREAIVAATQLSRSGRPQMRDLGARVVGSQTEQVRQMTAWIRDWYPGRPTTAAGYRPEMRDLSGLSGDQLDRAFLDDMVPHHMVAVMMSQHLLASAAAKHDRTARLASWISSEQRAEIVQMTRWSRAWFGEQPLMGMTGPMMRW